MNKTKKIFIPIFLLTPFIFSSCAFSFPNSSEANKELSISKLPNKTEYIVGENLSLSGMIVVDKDTLKEVSDYTSNPQEGYVFVEQDIGDKTIEISKSGYKNTSFTVSITQQSSDELDLKKENAIKELNAYYLDRDFNYYDEKGLEQLLEILNDAIDEIRKATSSAMIDETLENAKAVLDAVKKITPTNPIVSIAILSMPSKTTYYVDEKLDVTGLRVNAHYQDGTIEEITNFTVDDVDMSKEGTNVVVVVRYYNLTTQFTITIQKRDDTVKTVDIYATNDIHGQVLAESGRLSIAELGTYLKEKGEQDNTLLLDQGDTWQGSIYSNYNHGKLITDVMNYVQFDARTLGNHDFDWGVQYIIDNNKRSYENYQTPVLGANIYDYDFSTRTIGNVHQDDIGIKSVSYVLENGLKVGIVGTIGMNQITSINSLYTKDIAFIDHIPVIKDEATNLRNNGCDIVIACSHCGQEDLLGNNLSDYVDLVLCGHTHKNENYTENGLYFAQYGAYNRYVGHLQLSFDPTTKEVKYVTKESISNYTVSSSISSIDSTINQLVNEYNSECESSANQVVANNVSGSFYSSEEMPNLMCKSIYDQAVSEGFDVDLAYCNVARASIYSSSWNYADLYQAFPFDNEVFIFEVTYDEMKREIGAYNYVYRSPDFSGVVEKGKKYKVACLDYLLFHTNANRVYDYFFDAQGVYIDSLEDNYRIILKNWLIDNGYANGKALNSSQYSSYLDSFSREFTFK